MVDNIHFLLLKMMVASLKAPELLYRIHRTLESADFASLRFLEELERVLSK